MEKKEERPTQKNLDTESHVHLSNEDQRQMHVDYASKNPKTVSASLPDMVSSVTQQCLPTLQWPYIPQAQTIPENPLSRFTINIQQSSPVNANQRQLSYLNPQQQQQNPVNNQSQIGQSQATPAAGAFWLPLRPGFNATSTVYQPLATMVNSDSNWQAPVVVGASSGPEPISTYCYQGGYSYPMGFPGPWYPSTLWGQPQQSHPPYSLHYPAGGYGYFGAPPPVPDSSLSGQLQLKGIIPLAAKLSHKHQQMWEAQSAENVYLRTALCRVEAEMAAQRGRLIWLEAEVSSLKAQRDSAMEGSMGVGSAFAVKTLKRGRPKRTITSTIELPSEDIQPRSRGRKPTSVCKVEYDAKGLSSDKGSLNKEENGAKASHPTLGTISIQMKEDVKISSSYADGSVSELNASKLNLSTDVPTPSTFQNHAQKNPGIQVSGVGPNPALELKGSGKDKNRKTAFSTLHQSAKETNAKGASALHTHMWHSNIINDDCRRNMLNIRSHAFYDDTNIVRHEGKVFSGWSFVNEDASEEHEDGVGSGKDEGEMEEDTSSAADEMNQPKAEDNFGTNTSTVISKGLPQMNRW